MAIFFGKPGLAMALGVTGALVAWPALAQQATLGGLSDDDYSYDALVEAAKAEGPITVVDATGQIVTMAEAFTARYGIDAVGVRLSAQEQEQILTREAAAGNVQTDVFNMSNMPAVVSQLIPQGSAVSWFPPDLADRVPAQYQSPALTSHNPWVWVYNPDIHPDGCPVSNVWELTEAAMRGRVSMPDPLLRNETLFWFNQIETHADDAMAAAYEAQFGQALDTSAESATAQWVRGLAGNGLNIQRGDSDVGPVIGASTQDASYVGFLSTAIFRHAERDGYRLAICDGLQPFAGQLAPRVAVIAAGTAHPNAAKLFARFMMTEQGMAPQLADGKISVNTEAAMPQAERSGVIGFVDQLHIPDAATAAQDFARLQDWQDFWLLSSQ